MRRPSKPLNPDMQVRRIVALFNRATAEELQQGLSWYDTANTFCQGLAEKHNVTLAQAAGIVAALSPQTSWEQNQVLAEALCKGRKITNQTKANKDKALRIMRGDDPRAVLGAHERTGKKVRAFFECILNPQTSEAVCIDRHAFNLAEGLIYNSEDIRANALKRVGVYETIAGSYVKAAAILKHRPHVVQAVTWVVWRNLQKDISAPVLSSQSEESAEVA